MPSRRYDPNNNPWDPPLRSYFPAKPKRLTHAQAIRQWLAGHDRNIQRNKRFNSGSPARPIPLRGGKPIWPIMRGPLRDIGDMRGSRRKT